MRRQQADPCPALGKRLRDDGELFEELAYCVPKGIPYSHFQGGPRKWTQDDRDMAIAYEREIRSRCSQCGTRPDEWTKNPDAYVGDVEHCEGCARMHQEQQNEVGQRPGAKIRLIPLGAGVRKMAAQEGEA